MSEAAEGRRALSGLNALQRMRGETAATAAPPPAPQPTEARPTPEAPAASPPETAPAARSAPQSVEKPKGGTERRPRASQAARRAPTAPAATSKAQISVYLAASTRGRAQTAFEATRYAEGDTSFSEFVEKAVQREIERRERQHNQGNPYPPRAGRLPAGRPLS